jgi:hypothetical protein
MTQCGNQLAHPDASRYAARVNRPRKRTPVTHRPSASTKEAETMQQHQPGPSEVYAQFAGKTAEALGLWAETNQRVLKEIADFTAGTAKEGVRLYAEIQQNAIRTLSEAPASLPWQPASWQEGYQKAFKLFEGNIQAMSRSAERVQASAEQAGKGIQEALSLVADRMKA